MSIYASPGASFEATVDNAGTGKVGVITVRLEDGLNAIVTAASTAGIVESGVGVYTATRTAPLTRGQYVVIWNNGSLVEVAEDLTVTSTRPASSYFTVEDLRARYPELTVPLYSDVTVNETIALAEEAFEHAAGVAFTPRTETLTLTSASPYRLVLGRARVSSVTSITGSTTGSVTLTDGQLVAGGTFLSANPWDTTETLTAVVVHGYAVTPLRVKRAVMLLTRTWLVRGPVDDRATQIPSAEGGVINLSTPGQFGAVFGIPEVDATLADYRHRALVP